MNKICLTCTDEFKQSGNDFFSDSSSEIPLWFKRINNYSLLPPPLNCNPFYNAYKNINNFYTTDIPNSNLSIPIDLNIVSPSIKNKKNRWLFFWAAKKRDYNTNTFQIAPLAYADFSNSGLVKTDENGKTVFNLENPQLYKVDGTVYPPHIHFTYLKDDLTWSLNDTTIIVTPKLDWKVVKNKSMYTFINSDEVQPELTKDILKNKVKRKISEQSNKIYTSMQQIKEKPIVIYSNSNNKFKIGLLINKLRSIGFINILYC